MVRTFKFFLTVLTATVIFLSVQPSFGDDDAGTSFDLTTAQADTTFGGLGGSNGGDHPWPWGFEVPFPWEDIQGIWKLNKPGKSVFYSFRRLQAKRLAVNQFDLDTCEVTGAGPGLERAKTVVAQMNEVGTHRVYQLALYAFKPEDTNVPSRSSKRFDPGHVMVARILPMSVPSPAVAFQMVKITDRLEIRCPHSNKSLKF